MPTGVLLPVLSVLLVAVVLRALRRGGLPARTSLLWVATATAALVISATLPLRWVPAVARVFGFTYPPDFLLVISVIWLTVLLFDQAVSSSELQAKQVALTQELALLALDQSQASPAHPE